jgi:hypothetical protein
MKVVSNIKDKMKDTFGWKLLKFSETTISLTILVSAVVSVLAVILRAPHLFGMLFVSVKNVGMVLAGSISLGLVMILLSVLSHFMLRGKVQTKK